MILKKLLFCKFNLELKSAEIKRCTWFAELNTELLKEFR